MLVQITTLHSESYGKNTHEVNINPEWLATELARVDSDTYVQFVQIYDDKGDLALVVPRQDIVAIKPVESKPGVTQD